MLFFFEETRRSGEQKVSAHSTDAGYNNARPWR